MNIINLKRSLYYRFYMFSDKFLGVDLYKADNESERISGTSWYSTAFYPGLMRNIFRYVPKEKIVGVFDFGSGKGLGIVKFKKFGFKKVGGIELRHELVEICQRNLKKLKLETDLLIQGDAGELVDFDGYNMLFLFNPFPAFVVKKVASNVKSYVDTNDSEVWLVYVNPQHKEELEQEGFSELGSFIAPISHFKVIVYSFRADSKKNEIDS